MKKNLILVLLMNCYFISFGQSESYLIHISNHFNLINPAYLSANEEYFIKGSIKKHWSNVPDGPETQAASIGLPVGNNLGLGISVIRDKVFIENELSTSIDLSYNLQIDRFSNLNLGIKIGGSKFSIETDKLDTYNGALDPTLINVSRFNPNAGFGLLFTRNQFHLAASLPKLLKVNHSAIENTKQNILGNTPYLYLSSGYNFYLDNEKLFLFMPSVFTRVQKNLNSITDINAMLNYNEKFEFGFLYRTSGVLAFKIIANINSYIYAGFSNELATNQLSNSNSTSEFFLQFKW
jgi:type IX secretion system PorP/SprF family membrane protein